MNKKTFTAAGFLLLGMIAVNGAGVSAATASGAGPGVIWFNKPAAETNRGWLEEALPIGNGRLGCMVRGGISRENIQFNEDTVWIGDESDTGAYQNFGHMYIALAVVLLNGRNNGQNSYGYTAYLPERITVEKVRIEDLNQPAGYEGPAVLGNFNPGYKDASFVEKFPYIKTREVIIKDVTTASGKPLRVSNNPVMFRDVVVRTGGGK